VKVGTNAMVGMIVIMRIVDDMIIQNHDDERPEWFGCEVVVVVGDVTMILLEAANMTELPRTIEICEPESIFDSSLTFENKGRPFIPCSSTNQFFFRSMFIRSEVTV
jgi:hypothetical protein